MHVVLYSRDGCHLCEVARNVVLREREGIRFSFEEIDIAGDEGLEREFGIRVPVVVIDGEERFEFEVDPAELARILNSG